MGILFVFRFSRMGYKSINIQFLKKNCISPSQKLLHHLYHTILQHTQHPNFYFIIQHIKIIYLRIISILSYLSSLSNFYLTSSIFLPLKSPVTTTSTVQKATKLKQTTPTSLPITHHPPLPKQNPQMTNKNPGKLGPHQSNNITKIRTKQNL